MKSATIRNLFLTASLLLIAGASGVKAASGNWTGATDNTWAGANWSATPVPGTGDTATFNAASANTTIDLGGGVTVANILFNTGSAAAYTIGNGTVGSQTLTLNDNAAVTMNSTVANNELFNSALVLGLDATAKTYSIANNSGSTLTLAANITGGSTGVGATKTLTFGGTGNIVFGGNLFKGTPTSGTANLAIAKTGSGTLTVNPTSNVGSASGSVAVNGGTLAINFVNAGANASLLSAFSPLTLGGGTLQIIGNPANASAQTFAGVTVNPGDSVISAGGTTSPTLTLGAMTEVLGGSVVFNGPATTTYSGGNSVTPTTVAATATITTTTVGAGTLGLVQNVASGTAANLGSYATVGLYDWASTDVAGGTAGTSPYTIIGGSQVTGFYTATFGANMDVPAAGFALATGTQYGQTLRFNTPSATANTPTIVSNPRGDNVQCPGILVTPNMGAQNAGISGVTWSPYYGTTGNKVNAMQVWQNNTLGYFLFSAGFYNGRSGASVNSLVQNGPGTVVYASGNTQTGPTYLNGGYSVAIDDTTFGTPATAAAIYLNGGTVVATNSFTLDNAGVNKRPITLLANGGGLAAAAGTTLTVDGQIGSATGTGPLVIGIPASAANGYVAGLLPGSGTGTANTTPVYGTGTVVLNYASGTLGNFQYGGTIITGGATLNINSEYDLGGADQGPTIFKGGTLQYNSALATGTAGTVLDISVQPVTFTGNATIDFNGQTVTYANSIGNGGSGALTVTNSGSPGVGGLYLNGGTTHTGGTTVAAGAVLGSTGTLGGNVTWTTNSYASLSVSSPPTVSGSVTLTNTTVNVVASGLTTGVYTLLTATGGITSGSTVNSTPGGIGIVASGYAGTVSISGNSVILTVVQLGVSANWTDASGDQNWSNGGNWTGGTAPHSAGDAATFGSGGVGTNVNLNVNETVGGITFSNASSYVIAGANTLTLDNTTHGIPITVTAGTSNAINTAVALNGNVSAAVGAGDSLAFGGVVANQSTPETLTVTGGGTLALTNANTYGPSAGTVGTTLNGATLQLGNNASLGAGDVNVTANSTLQSLVTGLNIANNIAVASSHTVTANNNSGTVALSGVISGNGSVAAAGSGSLILSGVNNTYTGSTIINSGILSIAMDGASAGNAASLGTVPATVTPNNIIFNGGDLLATATFTLNANRGIGIGATSGSTGFANAFIDVAAGQALTIPGIIASAGNFGTNSLTVNSGAGNTGTLLLAAANTFNGTNTLVAGAETLGNSLALQNSTLNYIGGTFSFGTLTSATLGGLAGTQSLALDNTSPAAVALTVGNNGMNAIYTGTLSGDGSLNKVGAGSLTIGSNTGGGASYTGATVINNGTLTLDGNSSVSMSTANNVLLNGSLGASTLNLVDSAAVTTSGGVYLGSEPTGGNYGGNGYPSACTLTVQNNASLSAATLSYGGVGASTRVPNCTVTVANNGSINIAGAFELGNIAGSATPTGAVNVNGGTLAVGNFIFSSASATRPMAINLNGGMLEANASDPSGSTFLPVFLDTTVNVMTNGATINPNGNTITIAATLTGLGGLTNVGTGTLNLSAANTYAGATFITNGATLNVINTSGSATGTGAVTVGIGGTLEGTGIISGAVNWQSGALAAFNTGTTATPLTVGVVTLNNNTVTVNVPGTALTVGSYTLMNYTSAGSTGTFNPTPIFTGSGTASGTTATISTSGGVVSLIVSPMVTANVWNVDADGNWTTAADWSGNPTVPGNPGDAAELGIGSALRTITLNANESLGYLEMTNANSFVVANGGHILTLDNSGTGAYITVSGGTANAIQTAVSLNDNSSVVVNSGDSLTISGTIANTSSPEALTLLGAGKLILNNVNTYGPTAGSTGTTLQGGTLQVGNGGALGAGDVSFAGNSTLQSGAAGLVMTNNLSVNSGTTATLNDNGNTFTLGGVVTGGGNYVKVGAGTLVLTNSESFSGAFNVNAGTLVLSGSSSSGAVTNNAILQLANPSAVGGVLDLNSGSTLQLRSDTSTSFSPGTLAVQNASDKLNFDAAPLTIGVTGQTLTLSGTLAFAANASQTITVTGNSTFKLGLGDVTLTSSTAHTPFLNFNINTSLTGAGVIINSITAGAWGNDVNMNGGGNVTVSGNLSNTSNGEINLFVNNGTTVTLQGQSVKAGTGDGYKYDVVNGTLFLDSNGALINNTTGAGLNQSVFVLGAATNIISGATYTHSAGVLTASNNNYNAAVYLGDANNTGGSISIAANVTNYVSDGDVGFTNAGTFTIGGKNTAGVNTFNNPIILGWTLNRGKSVNLVAAAGGEVDFANILANGTDQTAGVIVGDAVNTGLVKFTGVNTYGGNTTVNGGTLEVANANFSTNSTISVTNGGLLQLDFSTANIVVGLVLNGTNEPVGTYSSGNSGGLITGSGSLQVVSQTPVLQTAPVASAIVYGQTVGASALAGGAVVNAGGISVPGTFAFNTPSSAPGAGISSQTVKFTPSNTNSYSSLNFNVNVTVGKATPLLKTSPSSSPIIYGQALSASSFTGGSVTNAAGVTVPGAFAFTTPSIVPGAAGVTNVSVVFTPTDSTDYNSITTTVGVTVNPQTPILASATALPITYGQALSNASLSVTFTNAAGTVVAGTAVYATPAVIPGAGVPGESVTFTPADTTDYNSVTFSVGVTVNQATPVLASAPSASAITEIQALSASTFTGGLVTNAAGATVAGTYTFTTPSLVPGVVGVTNVPVTFTPTDNTDYSSISLNVNVTVTPQVPLLQTPPTAQNITNGQALSASVLSGGSVTNAAGAAVAGTFAFTTPGATPGVGTANQSVTFTPTDTVNYSPITFNVSVTVVSAGSPLSSIKFTAKPVVSGTSLTISATNTGAGTIYLLSSTNVAALLHTWSPIWTNVVGGSSSFTTNLPNTVNPAQSRNFYILSTTNNLP